MKRQALAPLSPAPEMPSVEFQSRWMFEYGNDESDNNQYWLTRADAYRIDEDKAYGDDRWTEVTLYALRKETKVWPMPAGKPHKARRLQLVSFRALVRAADCGASCKCALEWRPAPASRG